MFISKTEFASKMVNSQKQEQKSKAAVKLQLNLFVSIVSRLSSIFNIHA